MRVILIVAGLNDCSNRGGKILNCVKNVVKKSFFFVWSFTLLLQIITLISQGINFEIIYGFKIYMSALLLNTFNIIFRSIFIYYRRKILHLLLQLEGLECVKELRSLKFQILIFTTYILVCVTIRNAAWYKNVTHEELAYISDVYLFRINWVNYPSILPCATRLLWITTEGIFQSTFGIIYMLTCYILKKEFHFIAMHSTECKSVKHGRKIIKIYKKALEIGKNADDILSPLVFFAILWMMITLFYRGFELFVSGSQNIYEVSSHEYHYYSNFD